MSPSTRPTPRARRPVLRSPVLRHPILGPGIATAALVLGLAACTPAPPEAAPSTSASAPSASAGGPSAPASTPSGSPSAAGLTIDITIAGGQVTPNAEKIDVTRGTTVRLTVTSDEDDEIHAHTAGDGYELEVKAGRPATGSFVASDTGSFEIESHHLEKVIAILQVR